MTIMKKQISEKIDSHIKQISESQDFEALRTASIELAESFRDYLNVVSSSCNDHERRISELQTFAMQVRQKISG